MSEIRKILLVIACLFAISSEAYAESFVVKKIEVKGLQGISLGTVLNYLPVKEGDRFDTEQAPEIIKDLYKTGFFSDVNVTSSNNVITIKVVERAVITSINISGNSKITKKQLLDVLKEIGLSEGQVLNQATLSGLEQILVQQYYNLGCYNVKIKTEVTPASRNRVILNIKINEGPAATIKEIHIIGNQAFDEKTLLKQFTLTTPKWWKFTFLTHVDQYSKEKLEGDLEKLRSYYMDRGYLKFKIDSTQVSLTPDKKHIYIIIHINEGSVYTISGFSLSGNLIGKEQEIRKYIQLKAGETFSRRKIMDINAVINQIYGNYGYANPDIKSDPVVDETKHTVFIKFSVDPGKKVYVRRITFSGNSKTDENVLRREMRQQEGALYSLSKINESKRRLANLGYIENIDSTLEPVPGHPDQVDLVYKVKETSSASATFQLGYSDMDGLIYGIHVDETNFMGTGRTVSVQFNNSSYYQTYGFTYYNPYHTINNISFKFDIYAQIENGGDSNDMSTYTMDLYGTTITYGIPLSDYSRLNAGYGYEYTKIRTDAGSPIEVDDFVSQYGDQFNEGKLIAGWSYNKLDRAIFPTRGFAQSINLEGGFPLDGNDLSYYKTNYNASWFQPLYKKFILHAKGEAGYGNSIGTVSNLPFFKNYYAGGMDSVRGFDGNSLGPKDSNGDAIGGNVLADASMSLIFPNPIGESMRTSLFVDVGNVYANRFELNQMHSAAGTQVEWRSPIGVLRFAITPFYLHTLDGDHKRFFDFSFGTSF